MIIRIVVSGRVKSAVVTSRNDITHCRLSQQRKAIVKYYYSPSGCGVGGTAARKNDISSLLAA